MSSLSRERGQINEIMETMFSQFMVPSLVCSKQSYPEYLQEETESISFFLFDADT